MKLWELNYEKIEYLILKPMEPSEYTAEEKKGLEIMKSK